MGLNFAKTSDADVLAIADAFARVTSRNPDSVALQLRHMVTAHPLGFFGIVAREKSGEVVAHFGATPIPVTLLGRDGVVGRLALTFVDPRYRVGGWHGLPVEVDSEFRETFENEAGIRALLATFSESDFWQMRRLGDHEALRTSVEIVRTPSKHAGSHGEGEVHAIDSTFCRAWTEPFKTSETCTRRDGSMMQFRLSGPYASDHGFAIKRVDQIKACVVFRDSPTERLVLDIACDPIDESCADRLIHVLIGDGLRRIVIPRFGRSSLLLRLQRAGFRVHVGDEVMLSVRSNWPRVNGASLADSWEISASDSGRFALPPILPADTACGPSPAGTRAGSDRHI